LVRGSTFTSFTAPKTSARNPQFSRFSTPKAIPSSRYPPYGAPTPASASTSALASARDHPLCDTLFANTLFARPPSLRTPSLRYPLCETTLFTNTLFAIPSLRFDYPTVLYKTTFFTAPRPPSWQPSFSLAHHLNLWDTTLRNTYTLRTPLKHFNVNVNVNFNAGIAIFHVLNFSSRTKYSPRDTLPHNPYHELPLLPRTNYLTNYLTFLTLLRTIHTYILGRT
jgi:hypothetical protein